jgi:hypothetical protein
MYRQCKHSMCFVCSPCEDPFRCRLGAHACVDTPPCHSHAERRCSNPFAAQAMSSLLTWCSEERPAAPDQSTAAATMEASCEIMMAAVGLEFGKPLVSVAGYRRPFSFMIHRLFAVYALTTLFPSTSSRLARMRLSSPFHMLR